MREVADIRLHGTTGEQPLQRFQREQLTLKAVVGRPPYVQVRELRRKVHTDLCIEVDTNHYSVPWRYIGEEVLVRVQAGELRILYAGLEIARHAESGQRRARIIDRRHYLGLVLPSLRHPPGGGELVRSLADYAQAAGGEA
jgi:hypothetical protein